MTIVLQADKGSLLTAAEADENVRDLRDGDTRYTPKGRTTTGIKIDPAAPDDGWHDIHGTPLFNSANINAPSFAIYRGGIEQILMAETEEFTINFHIPHDYRMGTDLFVHVHWSHTSATVTGGSATFGFETVYAKGFDQAAFPAPKLISIAQNASTTQYQHMVAEGSLSITGGSATQLDSDDLEVDGVIFARFNFDSNDITDSVTVPDIFIHFVDIHYQSTNVGTKQKAPDFWT